MNAAGTLNFADIEVWKSAESEGWKFADTIFVKSWKFADTLFCRNGNLPTKHPTEKVQVQFNNLSYGLTSTITYLYKLKLKPNINLSQGLNSSRHIEASN